MGSMKWRLVAIFCLAMSLKNVTPSQEIMHKMTTGFAKVFEQCKNELNVGDQIMQEFFNFWREDYQLVNRDLGCMVLCMASKFDLINDDMKLHYGNAHEFAKTHGADEAVAKQLVTMIHDCETLHLAVSDHCSRVLEISKCFRTKIHELKWAPSMEVILEEVMTSI